MAFVMAADCAEAACRALDQLQDAGLITYRKPHAAFYVFPKLADKLNIKDDRQLCFDFLAEKHILMVAGSGFDWPRPDHFRLVLLPEAQKIYDAILELGDFLSHYKQ